MKAIDYMKQIKMMDTRIDGNILEIAHLEVLATKTTSVMGGERVQASGSQEKMADCVAKMADMKEQLEKDIKAFIQYKDEARKLLSEACDPDCCRLLHLRYFFDWTWEQIAVEMKFTYQWVSGGLHQRALAQLQKALDERSIHEGSTI